jgi:acyl transferase domain-containing protein
VLQESPFYIPAKSHLWFVPETASRRIAAINGLGLDRSYAHLIVSEEPSPKDLRSRYLEQTPFYLFPLAAIHLDDLLAQLSTLQTTIEDAQSLPNVAPQVFSEFQKQPKAPYALAIAGQNKEELSKEIQRAQTGIPNAFEQQSDWKTPVGSYFTAQPQGQKGGVAFVYPGAFTSYIGFGYDINRLFPHIMDSLSVFTASTRLRGLMDLATARIYPRSLEKLSPRKLEKLETQLQDDATTMLLFGTLKRLELLHLEEIEHPQSLFVAY